MVFQPEARLHLGAEAEVWSGNWMGRPAVRKIRRHRAWRGGAYCNFLNY